MKQTQRREIGKETNQTSYSVKSKLFYVLGENKLAILYRGYARFVPRY